MIYGGLAQSVERETVNFDAIGSSPISALFDLLRKRTIKLNTFLNLCLMFLFLSNQFH